MPRRCGNTPGRGRNLLRGTDDVDTTQGASGGLVLLDEWHVQAFVAPELSAHEARDLRDRIDIDLRSWVFGLHERLKLAATVRVAIDR
jgi:hypothetical protein